MKLENVTRSFENKYGNENKRNEEDYPKYYSETMNYRFHSIAFIYAEHSVILSLDNIQER